MLGISRVPDCSIWQVHTRGLLSQMILYTQKWAWHDAKKRDKAWCKCLNLIFSSYHTDNREVKIALLCIQFGTQLFRVRKQKKITKLNRLYSVVYISQKDKCIHLIKVHTRHQMHTNTLDHLFVHTRVLIEKGYNL